MNIFISIINDGGFDDASCLKVYAILHVLEKCTYPHGIDAVFSKP